MSNGQPHDIIDEKIGRSYVAYAEGCNPHSEPNGGPRRIALVGDDDFSKTLPWAEEIKKLIDKDISEIVIEFNADRIALVEPQLHRRPAAQKV